MIAGGVPARTRGYKCDRGVREGIVPRQVQFAPATKAYHSNAERFLHASRNRRHGLPSLAEDELPTPASERLESRLLMRSTGLQRN